MGMFRSFLIAKKDDLRPVTRALCGGGVGGGIGRDNYKRCSCIEGRDTLWLF